MPPLRWKKLGKIFDPTQHRLPHGCETHAQSPQALVLADRVRIFFSTRQRDPSNAKYLSRVCFVDFDKSFQKILRIADREVVPLGQPGCFDEHGIFPMHVMRHEGRVRGYTSGWTRRVSVSVDTGIGLAFSDDDGLSFRKIGDGPVLSAAPREPFLVGDPFVQVHEGRFNMWYIFGVSWKKFSAAQPPDRVYKIGHAVSTDGIDWQRPREGQPIISDRLHEDESQALPTVIGIDGRHHMFFCYRESSDFRTDRSRGYRLGHAWSDDLETWTRDDALGGMDVSSEGWDSEMQCYPHLFECDGRVHLLYNGNAFGRTGFGVAILE